MIIYYRIILFLIGILIISAPFLYFKNFVSTNAIVVDISYVNGGRNTGGSGFNPKYTFVADGKQYEVLERNALIGLLYPMSQRSDVVKIIYDPADPFYTASLLGGVILLYVIAIIFGLLCGIIPAFVIKK
ncbi:MAG: hypothetical protein Q7S66_02670 [bacterium]|nr:hypothetical protein [bacterium]